MIHTPLRHESPLALNIDPRVSVSGDFATSLPGLSLFRRDQPTPPALCMIEPSLILVGRGEKRLRVGGEGYCYDPSRFLVTSLDLPANSEVFLASPEQPCAGLVLKRDVSLLAKVITKVGLPAKRYPSMGSSAGIGNLSCALEGALDRLLTLLDEPEAIPVLAPLILREIHYRLLNTDQGEGCGRSLLSMARVIASRKPLTGSRSTTRMRCCVESHSRQKRSATQQVERKTRFTSDAPHSVSPIIKMHVNR